MSVNLDGIFQKFHAIDSLGGLHIGVRPSRISKELLPFQAVKFVVDGNDILPTVPEGEEVFGFSYAVKCSMDLDGTDPEYFPKMIALLSDGRKWETIVNSDGTFTMGWTK